MTREMKYLFLTALLALLGVVGLYVVTAREAAFRLESLESRRSADARRMSELEAARIRLEAESQSTAAAAKDRVAALENALSREKLENELRGERIVTLENQMNAPRARLYRHGALFYDTPHIGTVKSKADAEPYRSALQELKSRADSSLTIIPRPIRQPLSVPSPNVDPERQRALVEPLEDSARSMLALAQYYVFSGDERYAGKAVEIATAWTGSLMELEDAQAVYHAAWEMLAMAVAADTLDGYAGWAPEQRQAFNGWLNERAWHVTARDVSHNNHIYWIGAFAAAAGIVTEDPGLLRWSGEVYKDAIAYGMAADGHFPAETDRGALGMFYQNFAIEPLVLIAEIADRQGNDLWSFSYRGKTLKLAIDYLMDAFDKPEQWPWSRQRQDLSFLEARGDQKIGWFEIGYYRFHDKEMAEYLEPARPLWDRRGGGATTLTHGLPLE